MITLNNVTKRFGEHEVLSEVSLTIHPGEFVCLTGHSGAGKSVLLGLLCGAEEVTSGSISIDDIALHTVKTKELQQFRRRVGMIFQDGRLLQQRTVAENIALPLEVYGANEEVIAARTEELLTRMDLKEHANALPSQLSTGEQMRTAIARAVAHQPLIVLADEPTGNLDEVQAQIALELLFEVHKTGTTVILATHNEQIGTLPGVRTIRLEHGHIVQDTGSNLVQTPEPSRSATASAALEAVNEEEEKKRKVKITAIKSE